MYDIKQILQQQEGRRLEFKAEVPANSDLAKTIVAFANDAGGDIFIGIDNAHRAIGIPEDDLPRIEEQICNMVYDRCYPTILPEINFLTIDDKHLIRIRVYRGSMPPYYLKENGKLRGTFIRVGSNNRRADESIIAELERKHRNVSYDSELVMEKTADEVSIDSFKKLYEEKTGEAIDTHVLRKLELVREEQGKYYPTNALILLSDDSLRETLFPLAKVECARFKGTTTDIFIDQKTIATPIGTQAEEAYNFVLRHINEEAIIEGVYTVRHWEYPVKAIREIIRNAVVHRQYSLGGRDIKVAIYDDMLEVTSPGLLPPSIDYADMESRQSDARNKVIARVFKKLGIIDQWGNGLKLVAEELRQYPHIELRWKEVGLSFQVQFVNKKPNGDKTEHPTSTRQAPDKYPTSTRQVLSLLEKKPLTVRELMQAVGLKNRESFVKTHVNPLLTDGLITLLYPNAPKHPKQKYELTSKGTEALKSITHVSDSRPTQ